MRDRKPWVTLVAVAIALPSLAALYMGVCYAALGNHVMEPVISAGVATRDRAILGSPSYRFGGEYSARLFYPACLIDKHLAR